MGNAKERSKGDDKRRKEEWKRTTGIHRIGGCLGPRGGRDSVEKRKFMPLPGIESRTSSI
jgi:hypothetical protein